MTDQLEDRVRACLEARAGEVEPSSGSFTLLARKVAAEEAGSISPPRPRRMRAVIAAVVLVTVGVGGFVAMRVLGSDGDVAVVVETVPVVASTAPSPPPTVRETTPTTTIRDQVGEQTAAVEVTGTDPVEIATSFVRRVSGYELVGTSVEETANPGAFDVTLAAYDEPGLPSFPVIVVRLLRLPGDQDPPAWRIVESQSPQITTELIESGADIGDAVRVAGTAAAPIGGVVEAAVVTDDGLVLGWEMINAPRDEPAPFTADISVTPWTDQFGFVVLVLEGAAKDTPMALSIGRAGLPPFGNAAIDSNGRGATARNGVAVYHLTPADLAPLPTGYASSHQDVVDFLVATAKPSGDEPAFSIRLSNGVFTTIGGPFRDAMEPILNSRGEIAGLTSVRESDLASSAQSRHECLQGGPDQPPAEICEGAAPRTDPPDPIVEGLWGAPAYDGDGNRVGFSTYLGFVSNHLLTTNAEIIADLHACWRSANSANEQPDCETETAAFLEASFP